jgi:hypothetical protein
MKEVHCYQLRWKCVLLLVMTQDAYNAVVVFAELSCCTATSTRFVWWGVWHCLKIRLEPSVWKWRMAKIQIYKKRDSWAYVNGGRARWAELHVRVSMIGHISPSMKVCLLSLSSSSINVTVALVRSVTVRNWIYQFVQKWWFKINTEFNRQLKYSNTIMQSKQMNTEGFKHLKKCC